MAERLPKHKREVPLALVLAFCGASFIGLQALFGHLLTLAATLLRGAHGMATDTFILPTSNPGVIATMTVLNAGIAGAILLGAIGLLRLSAASRLFLKTALTLDVLMFVVVLIVDRFLLYQPPPDSLEVSLVFTLGEIAIILLLERQSVRVALGETPPARVP